MAQGKRLSTVLELGDLVLHQTKQEVTINGKAHHLTPKECRLLATFMQHPGKVLTREFLMQEVWETEWVGDCATLELRRIQAIHG